MHYVFEARIIGNVDIGLTGQYYVHVVSFVSLFHQGSPSFDLIVQQESGDLKQDRSVAASARGAAGQYMTLAKQFAEPTSRTTSG